MKQMAITLIDEAVAAGARQHRACAVLGISCRTLRRWRHAESLADGRKGAKRRCSHALSDEEKAKIVEVCNSPEHQSLPPSQIVPRLADEGTWIASESSFYRVLREQDQIHRRGREEAPRKASKPKAWAATTANRVWSWDITYLPTAIRGEFYRLYLIMDIYSRKVVGWEIHRDELATHASELVDKACLREKVSRDQLVLHADNGGPMKGATMLATLHSLGVVPSFSRPSVSNDNPYSESLFRTLKFTPTYPTQPFESLDDARQWVQRFVTWYNTQHRHSGIKFVTPEQRHSGKDSPILEARRTVYESAKRQHPDRWRGRPTRNWHPVGTVWLNPDHPAEATTEPLPLAA